MPDSGNAENSVRESGSFHDSQSNAPVLTRQAKIARSAPLALLAGIPRRRGHCAAAASVIRT